MMKMFKYLFRKAKRNILFVGGLLLLLMFSTFLMNDLIAVASGAEKYLFLFIKWSLILLFLSFIAYNLLKVFNAASDSVSLKPKEVIVVQDDKKEKIMGKTELKSKSDRIMDKYMEAG